MSNIGHVVQLLMAPVAREVREYIAAHPSVSDGLKMGIVNYSALARKISKELGIRQREAVLAACPGLGRLLEWLLTNEVSNDMGTRPVPRGLELDDAACNALDAVVAKATQVSVAHRYDTVRALVSRVTKKLRSEHLIGVTRGLVEIDVTSPETIEKTPGLLAFLSGALASRGINIIEEMSAYTDTIFLLERKDMTRAMEVLAQNLQ